MTSQVAVSNYYGMAIASDTVSSRETSGGTKTVGQTNKIYSLGQDHKVLVLHSGCTVVNEVPSALYVTEWTKTLHAPLETVQDYIDSFLRWSRESAHLHDHDSELNGVRLRINDHFRRLSRLIEQELVDHKEASFSETDKQTEVDLREILLSVIKEDLAWLKTVPPLDDFSLEEAQSLVKDCADSVAEAIKYYFEEYKVSSHDHALLKESAAQAILAAEYLTADDSFLAFVGYGATQSFPWNRKMICRGYYNGRLVSYQHDIQEVKPGTSTSGISFFAQDDFIQSFIRGFHADILEKIESLITTKFKGLNLEKNTPEMADEIAKAVSDEARDYSYKQFVTPLLNEVDGMNIPRLAEFAESLVGLQATAAKAQDGPATVGGYIEVATIDRANGVRWVKSLDSAKL